jgi:Uncharacterized protein conserved in bacteria (DUF2188)
MPAPNRRTVSPHGDRWAVEKPGASRASSVHDTQKEAQDAARQNLLNFGGGELVTQGRDGKIRAEDTIGRPDPFPPRG